MNQGSQNFARALVIEQFLRQIGSQHFNDDELKVGVIGGSKMDPEIEALRSKGFKLNVTTFGIENSDVNLDLNEPLKFNNVDHFHLILCSQVLEHIWNHQTFFDNLKAISKKNTFLWLAVPAINHPHGSPEYFSAGFSPEYLIKNLSAKGFEVIDSGSIGSKRLYFSATFLGRWLSVDEYRNPIFEIFKLKSLQKNLYHKERVFDLLRVSFKSKKIINDIRFSTESWCFSKL